MDPSSPDDYRRSLPRFIPGFSEPIPDEIRGQAAGLRNVIVHEYFGIDHEIIWGVIERDLPSLKARILCLPDE